MKAIQRVDCRMAASCNLIGGGHACSQAGKTRKCNSWKLSGYDISGSYSICSQTLKWRLAWRGGRKVTTVSSLPVNPTTPSVQKEKIRWEGNGEEKKEGRTGRKGNAIQFTIVNVTNGIQRKRRNYINKILSGQVNVFKKRQSESAESRLKEWKKEWDSKRRGGWKVIQSTAVIFLCQAWLI